MTVEIKGISKDDPEARALTAEDWNAWRAMPQTRRLLGYLEEAQASVEKQLAVGDKGVSLDIGLYGFISALGDRQYFRGAKRVCDDLTDVVKSTTRSTE